VPDEILVAPYDATWPEKFREERALLARVLEPWLAGGIHHVGSTAVPGLAAKPVIDMIAGVRDFEEARAAGEPLRLEGYLHEPHRPGIAHHFVKGDEYGLHLTEPGSGLWRERLAFRDALRADGELAAEYEALKLRLAEAHRGDIAAYTAGKRSFVAKVLAGAGLAPGRR
jgi:GrpB-like predicted nucleotidyltransferase (UPF0157 family)